MLLRPDEVTNLKKGRQIILEIEEGDIRILKRNFCGVYELYPQNNPRHAEYFEDLTLFKNRYGSTHKKFPLYNLVRQRLDIYAVADCISAKELLKWFGEYGKIIHIKTMNFAGINVDYYKWLSDSENTVSKFQIASCNESYTLNIKLENKIKSAC